MNCAVNADVIPFDDNELTALSNDESDNDTNALFMLNELIVFKDGKGITRDEMYLGPTILDGVLKHKIFLQNDAEFFVDGILLSPLNEGAIPATIEQYVAELPKLTHQQIEQFLNPQIQDEDQHEFVALHCKMNHLPFPAMTTLAEKGLINKKFVLLKIQSPICMSCNFGMSHCKPWHTKGAHGLICKDSDDTPAKCISMDQLVSAQPELIPQMASPLTNLRKWGTTISVGHVSGYIYVALLWDLTLDETLLAKSSF